MPALDFESVFATIPSPYMVLDERLNFVAVNKAYATVVKLPAERIVGKNLFELFPNEDEEGLRLRTSLRKVLETGASDTIAFIPYAIPRPPSEGGGFEQRYWTAVHTPLTDESGHTAFVVQNTVDVSDLVEDASKAIPDEFEPADIDVLQRAREAERAYQETLAESAEFRRLFQEASGMTAILQGHDHLIVFANDAYQALTDHRDLSGLTMRNVFPEPVDRGFIELLDDVYRNGTPRRGDGVRVMLRRSREAESRESFIDFFYQPTRDRSGAITGVLVQGTDRTDQYKAAQRQRLLVDELNHRVKNTLSTVQSLARRSFRGADGRAFGAFESRIKALSNVHDVISDRHWEKVSLDSLLRQELAAFGAHRVAIAGPAVDLVPKAAIAFAMVFHELASNALKYGSLAADEGSLAVEWSVAGAGEPQLDFQWQERGNRSSPTDWSNGFGMKTLHRIIEGELGGAMHLDLNALGFICRIQVALREVGEFAS